MENGSFSRKVLAVIAALCLVRPAAAGDPVRSLAELRQEKIIKQKFDLSCGAAALATLLKYQHGENLSERDVALSLMTRKEYILDPGLVQQREGFSLLDLKRAASAAGYSATGYGRLSLQEMLSRAPIIVPIQTNGYNHFVIVRGVYSNRILLADPAWGNRTMLVEEFVNTWIDFPRFGHVGLTVVRSDGSPPSGDMAARATDFPFVR
jgi:predicted double-glycine peptidase